MYVKLGEKSTSYSDAYAGITLPNAAGWVLIDPHRVGEGVKAALRGGALVELSQEEIDTIEGGTGDILPDAEAQSADREEKDRRGDRQDERQGDRKDDRKEDRKGDRKEDRDEDRDERQDERGHRPGHDLPNVPNRPGHDLPNTPNKPSQGLPNTPGKPNQGLPTTPSPKK